MQQADEFSEYYADLLDGKYDCVDRIVFNPYFSVGQHGGGLRSWWRRLHGTDENLTEDRLRRMAGRFSRRCRATAKAKGIPVIDCKPGDRKHEIAEDHLPADPNFVGVFLILVARAPAKVFTVRTCANGMPHLEVQDPWPFVNHYSFHILDPDWGHITIKMSSHPPFGAQVAVNAHEWVERRARKQGLDLVKEGNAFTQATDLTILDQLADSLNGPRSIGRLAEVCDRWIYSSCLCFGLTSQEQERSGFRYQYSAFQLEYSRNLLFARGGQMEQIFQGLIDRSRSTLHWDKIRTILGRKHRPRRRRNAKGKPPRFEVVVETLEYDLTVLRVHAGHLTLRIYTKGACMLRVEAVVHYCKVLGYGKALANLPQMVQKLQGMVVRFLDVLHYADKSFLDQGALDALPEPTTLGAQRLAGIDLNKARMRDAVEAVLALGVRPNGFSTRELAESVCTQTSRTRDPYSPRKASYDLKKIRGKGLVEPIQGTRRYRVTDTGFRTLCGLLVLRDKVIKPVLAGAARPRRGRPPKLISPIDVHYRNLQHEMHQTFEELGLVA